jgi:hypothetical protein
MPQLFRYFASCHLTYYEVLASGVLVLTVYHDQLF